MEIFLLSFVIVLLAIIGMAIGALAGRRPLTGGCGGAGRSLGAGIGCGACGVEGRDGMLRAKGRDGTRPIASITEGSRPW